MRAQFFVDLLNRLSSEPPGDNSLQMSPSLTPPPILLPGLQDHEEELHARCSALFDTLAADVARYDGFPPHEQAAMLDTQASVLVVGRQARARGLLAYVDRALQRQAADWRSQVRVYPGWGGERRWVRLRATLGEVESDVG